jgi:SAM-dependent methyltransferase
VKSNYNHRDLVCEEFNKFFLKEKPKGILVDVGCRGTELKQYFTDRGFKWIGVDRDGNTDVQTGLMEAMPFPNDFVDVLFCCHAFEHCEEPLEALREFKRVLKPNGFLFLATPSPCEHQILNGDDDHIFVLHPMQMIRLLKYTGWENGKSYIQSEDIPKEQDFNVITICKKGAKNEL